MKGRVLLLTALLTVSTLGFAAANGAWLKKVPQADRERVNPFAGNAEAIAAGENLFQGNCAKCHGENAEGKGSRPALKSERIKSATDGEIAWLLKTETRTRECRSGPGSPNRSAGRLSPTCAV